MRSGILIIIVGTIAVMTVFGVNFARERLFTPQSGADTWQTYTSQTFGFSIAIPSDWTIIEFPNDEIAPRVNMYSSKAKFVHPITHHSDVPNVSIFPHGVPTEGFFGEFIDSDVIFSEETSVAHDFILNDGSHFATFASFTHVPESWNESGFIWGRAKVRSLHTECSRKETRISSERCDPLAGDTVMHGGSLNEKEREIEKTILSSFKFVL